MRSESFLSIFLVTVAATGALSQPTSGVDWGNSHEVWVRHARAPVGEQNVVLYRHVNVILPGGLEGEVRVSRWDGHAWQREVLDTWLAEVARPDIAVRPDGLRGVAYTRWPLANAVDPLKSGVVYRSAPPGQAWSPVEVVAPPPAVGLGIADPAVVAFGDDQDPRVGYFDVATTRYRVKRRDGVDMWEDVADFVGQPGLPCGHRWADMALDGDGTMHAACVAGDAAPNTPVYYYRDPGAGAAIQEIALPGVANHYYERPAIVRNGNPVAITAILRSAAGQRPLGKIHVTERNNNVWSPASVAFADVAEQVSIARLAPVDASRYVVARLTSGLATPSVSMRVATRAINGTFTFDDVRLVDKNCDVDGYGGLHPESPLVQGLDVSVDDGDNVQLSYSVTGAAGTMNLKTARLELPAPRDNVFIATSVHTMVGGAIDGGHEPWQCFFDSVQGIQSLRVRRWDGLQQAWVDDVPPNLGLLPPPLNNLRGCSVEVASTGRVGLTWSDLNANKLRFAEKAPGGAWVIGPDVAQGVASPMHELRWSGDGARAFVAYIRVAGGFNTVHVGERPLGGAWATATSAALNVSTYLSLDVNALGAPVPRIAYISGNQLRYTRRTGPNTFSAPTVLFASTAALNSPAIASRFLGSPALESEQVAVYDVITPGLRVFGRVANGAWAQTLFHNPPGVNDEGRTPSLAIDAFGKPVVVFRDTTGLQLSMIRWNRGGGAIPANAQLDFSGAFQQCDLDEGGNGPALRLDRFDNPRVSHRAEVETTGRPVRFNTRP